MSKNDDNVIGLHFGADGTLLDTETETPPCVCDGEFCRCPACLDELAA